MAFVIGDSCIGCGSCAQAHVLLAQSVRMAACSLLMVHSVFLVEHAQVHVLLALSQRNNFFLNIFSKAPNPNLI